MPIPQIYRTVTMIGAVQAMPSHRTFLRDRYFPCTPATDIFPTEEVLVEYRNGNKKIAPVVMPRKGGINIAREGYKTVKYVPPFVAPQRPLTRASVRTFTARSLHSSARPRSSAWISRSSAH